VPPSESDLLALIGLIYDTTDNPAAWATFLERYAAVFAADVAFIQRHWFSQHSSRILDAFGLSSPFRASYNEHYAHVNIWRDRGGHKLVEGRVILDQELCPRSALVHSEFYNDYLVPMGAVHCVAGVVARNADKAVTVAAMRGVRQLPFDEGDRRALEVLLPHVTRARTIGERLGLLDSFESALETVDSPLLFMTAMGRVVHHTAAAERILSSGDGLSLRHDALYAGDAAAEAQLRAGARAAARQPSVGAPATVLVSRPSLKRPYQVLMTPVRHQWPRMAGLPCPDVVVLVIDPETQPSAAKNVLIMLFGLTRREAALAAALSAGATVEQAADALKMTYETARTHLRRIFSKTGTSRQVELVMALARLPKQQPTSEA
jgi:DNA-binding CsgD family transcriptional regulator